MNVCPDQEIKRQKIKSAEKRRVITKKQRVAASLVSNEEPDQDYLARKQEE